MKKKNNKKSSKKGTTKLKNINNQLMPIAESIEQKMIKLQQKYGFNIDFAFKEITEKDIKQHPSLNLK